MRNYNQSIKWAICFVLASTAISKAAWAQRPAQSPRSTAACDDYGYVFSDDVMQAGVFTPSDPKIVVAVRAARVLLVRPRTAFVSELRKSVENL